MSLITAPRCPKMLLVVSCAAALAASPSDAPGADSNSGELPSIRAAFTKPSAEHGPYTWWHWMNGNVSKSGITADLEAMRDGGLRGAYLFDIGGEGRKGQTPPGPVRVLSDQWFEHVQHAANEAERLGLELLAHNCPGWSTSAGPSVSLEDSMKRLTWAETVVRGGTRVELELEKPKHSKGFYRDIAVFAVLGTALPRVEWHEEKIAWKVRPELLVAPPDAATRSGVPLDRIVQLTRLDGDRLEWDAPVGAWTVIRLGYTTTGRTNHPTQKEGRGWEVDKMDPQAVRRYFRDGLPGKLATMRTRNGEPAFRALLLDSHEAGMQNWTPGLLDEFTARRGYDARPYLAALAGVVVEDAETTDRFLWDFRRTLADLTTQHHCAELRRLCHAAGMELHLEPYAQGNYESQEYSAQADVLKTEFWKGYHRPARVKPVASAAHALGRNEVRAEAFTSSYFNSGWRTHPWALKEVGDWAWSQGVNRYVFHTWAHQALPESIRPGMTMGPWGMCVNQRQTWWPMANAWMQYIQRSQGLLQAGSFVGDIAILTDERVPRAEMDPNGSLGERCPAGFDYDVISPGLLVELGTSRDGKLVLGGETRYSLLLLPRTKRVTVGLMRRIDELARAGVPMVASTYAASTGLTNRLAADAEVRGLSESLARDAKSGLLPHFFLDVATKDALGRIGVVPDFAYRASPEDARINWIHRRDINADYYFIANSQPKRVRVTASFRVVGRRPEWWDPVTGETDQLAAYESTGQSTAISLVLEPWQSGFVVFPREPSAPPRWARLEPVEDPSGHRQLAPKFVIMDARYGRTMNAEGSRDIRGELQRDAQDGRILRRDLEEQLLVRFRMNGETNQRWLLRGETLDLEAGGPASPRIQARLSTDGDSLLVNGAGSFQLFPTGEGRARTISGQTTDFRRRLQGPWRIEFPDGMGAPDHIEALSLKDLSDHPSFNVRHYSGRINYKARFEAPASWLRASERVKLSVARVATMARVKCNGKVLGIIWCRPYEIDLMPSLRTGENELEIEVANCWSNRLIGDEHFPDDCERLPGGMAAGPLPDWVTSGRFESRPIRQRRTFAVFRHYTATDELPPSGLIGPAELVRTIRIPVD